MTEHLPRADNNLIPVLNEAKRALVGGALDLIDGARQALAEQDRTSDEFLTGMTQGGTVLNVDQVSDGRGSYSYAVRRVVLDGEGAGRGLEEVQVLYDEALHMRDGMSADGGSVSMDTVFGSVDRPAPHRGQAPTLNGMPLLRLDTLFPGRIKPPADPSQPASLADLGIPGLVTPPAELSYTSEHPRQHRSGSWLGGLLRRKQK